MTISDLEADRPTHAGTVLIHGHELDIGDGGGDVAAMVAPRWRGIQLCYCVHDSPESPCPCMHDRRWWFPMGSIISARQSDRRDLDGRALQAFEIARGTPVLVEMNVETLVREAKASTEPAAG